MNKRNKFLLLFTVCACHMAFSIAAEEEDTLSRRGKVVQHPNLWVQVLSPVHAVVKDVKVLEGQKVSRGEVLAVLESREMAELKANFLAAREREILAASIFKREEKLFQKQIDAEEEFLHARSDYIEAQIQLQLAKQKLQALGISEEAIHQLGKQQQSNLSRIELCSPIDGFILTRNLVLGAHVDDTEALFEIANLTKVWVKIGIFPRDYDRIKEGQKAMITSPSNPKMHAEAIVIGILPIIHPESITTTVIAELENPQFEWQLGSLVNAQIAIGDKND